MMEFSFEYYDWLKEININTSIIKSVAFFGVLLLIVPARICAIFMSAEVKKKFLWLVFVCVIATWLFGSLVVGVMASYIPGGLKLFLAWLAVLCNVLGFTVANHSRLYKIYEQQLSKGFYKN
ncbi:hypothetical protein [Cellulophaga sp. E6(2014)]|uniref:hypothetical protein n=1 Tax=Cellulophaga sp. E6(2014) TaxID=1495334 RepID=UPI00051DC71E|nr:hypothetical protein [Cellulophaga sp. E6(2014)]KGK30607.1 hypothetical protein EL45_09360 [Cellulophaga sp. E6(2014)]